MKTTQSADRPVVLVVEDEPLVRMIGADILGEEGFEVLEAASADEALVIFGVRQDIRVLFTDVEMPGSMNGYALARWVFSHQPSVETVIVSGRSSPEAGDMPPRAQFISKPYDPDDMVRHIKALSRVV